MSYQKDYSRASVPVQYQAVFQLIKNSLFSTLENPASFPADVDWEFAFREMQNQSVVALPYLWLRNNPIPIEPLQERWMAACAAHQARWIKTMVAQSQLIELLEKNTIPCVIIKGSASAMLYPYPSLRTVGDIDFLVSRANREKAAEILEINGFSLIHEKDGAKHHYSYMKDGVHFELHSRLAIVRETDEDLVALFEKGIEERTWAQIDGYSFPILPVELNGLVLLFHINQHLRSGLGFRQIIDWMMYLEKNNNLAQLRSTLKKTGMEKLALTVTAMCQKYFGLEPIVEESDDYPCDELMLYILEKGNFGKKSGEKGKTESVFLDASSPTRLFLRLQAGGLTRWKAAKKHAFLRPFAWIYQIGFICRELIRWRIGPKEFFHSRRIGMEQRELIHKLGLRVERSIQIED